MRRLEVDTGGPGSATPMPKTLSLRRSCQDGTDVKSLRSPGRIRRVSRDRARVHSSPMLNVSPAASIYGYLPSADFGNTAQFLSPVSTRPLLSSDQRVWLMKLLFR